MNNAKKLLLFIFLLLFFFNKSYSEAKVVFYNVDRVLLESKAGKSVKAQLEKINKTKLASFKKIEKKLIADEKTLLGKKNILAKNDFEIEFKKLSNEAAIYREKKQKDINDANLKRINATAKLLSLINPILAKYSEEKNISIILSKKNIIMGKNELDITDDIMVLVDKQIKEFKIK